MVKKKHMTIPQLARLLGLSRIAVYKRVKKGLIPATKVGGTYIISDPEITHILEQKTSSEEKRQVNAAVKKTVREYGEVLKQLGKE